MIIGAPSRTTSILATFSMLLKMFQFSIITMNYLYDQKNVDS